ncbi:MAG: hypothetical protein KF768_11355 [Phycisphaeraceae bacterium]|nr:hypothetical protein [Phycisphaeraceae bacterium]
MAERRAILIERGQGRKTRSETLFVPHDSVLVDAAIELRAASDGVKGTYGQYEQQCVGVYRPPRSYSTQTVDPFTREVLSPTTTHPIREDCEFYHWDGTRLTSFATAFFETDPPTIVLHPKLATAIQGDLFATPIERSRMEGAPCTLEVSSYERDPMLRAACIRHHGSDCAACGMSFGAVYGAIAEGFIHVHHRQPLGAIGAEHAVDPVTDLVPLCPNCHAVAHMQDPPLTPEEIKTMRGEMNGPPSHE